MVRRYLAAQPRPAALDPAPPPGAFPVELSPVRRCSSLALTLHGAGGNSSDKVRRGAIVSYCLGWLKPYENQWLAYPPAIARHFSPELAALVGYAAASSKSRQLRGPVPFAIVAGRAC